MFDDILKLIDKGIWQRRKKGTWQYHRNDETKFDGTDLHCLDCGDFHIRARKTKDGRNWIARAWESGMMANGEAVTVWSTGWTRPWHSRKRAGYEALGTLARLKGLA